MTLDSGSRERNGDAGQEHGECARPHPSGQQHVDLSERDILAIEAFMNGVEAVLQPLFQLDDTFLVLLEAAAQIFQSLPTTRSRSS